MSDSSVAWQKVLAGLGCTIGIALLNGQAFSQDAPLSSTSPQAAAAQTAPDETATTAVQKPQAQTTQDPQVPVGELQLLVTPLTQEELQVEAEAWRDLLKAKVQEIADVRIARSRDAEADTTPPADPEALARLQEDKAELVDRLNVVLDNWEQKGGDVEAYRKYVAALTGVAVDVTDTVQTWTLVRTWMTSEQGGQRWAWNLAKFLLILGAFYIGASLVASVLRHAVARIRGVSQLLINFVGTFSKQVVMIVGGVVALAALEVNIAPLLAAIGAAGFVIGFALQDTLGNFASGMMILAYRPFDVGDVVEAAGVSGIVDSVTLFSTHIRTFDNKLMIVPNNDIWGGTITNATASTTRRVDLVFGISYEDDVDQAQQILERLVSEHPLVLDDPAPTIKLNELGDSSVNFICRPWAKTGDYWTVYWDLMRSIKQAFDQEGISIPYPQRTVHLVQESGAAETK